MSKIIGLSSTDALKRLHKDFERIINDKNLHANRKVWNLKEKSWLKDSLHHSSKYTTLCWTSAVVLLFSSFSLFWAYFSLTHNFHDGLWADAFVILILLMINMSVIIYDNRLRHKELLNKAKTLLETLQNSIQSVSWNSSCYPHLSSPASPCITLQWTYRDGEVVNLPWALLVKGDVIVIRPGQIVPGLCSPLNDVNGQKLYAKEVYGPSLSTDPISFPCVRAPIENKLYILEETPYMSNLRLALEQCLDKPDTYFNKERYIIILTITAKVTYYVYLNKIFEVNIHWAQLFLVDTINTILPLLPIIFPVFWFVYNSYAVARIRSTLDSCSQHETTCDPYEDADVNQPTQVKIEHNFDQLQRYFKDAVFGRELLCRCVNILHVLGSVTVLCCVDKKGILSWPNPTAEKVFFLRNCDKTKNDCESINSDLCGDILENNDLTHEDDTVTMTIAEVLDLTHDHYSPFKLQFDDQSWKQHINSLKPLGLAILLNTCNVDTQEQYTRFCSHIMCEALHSEDLVPVTNRRCLCELAKQIGFQQQAQQIFQLEELLGTFKHVQSEAVRKDNKFAKQLAISTKLKFPFPHMMATVVREKQSGCLQLMSQGTADVILDSCVEFWDGHDICVLTQNERKKILDFYQRSSLTSYCTAFSYRPLSKEVSSKLSHVYLELPADTQHLYMPYRSPTPLAVSTCENKWRGILAQYHSTDSLLNTESRESETNENEACFELQCNQIFIGMVTMQYQAQCDIVQLIEQLERACIRFVHFSKENELRSRVFSEKMGLESGWNCHISLLSDRNREVSESHNSESWINVTATQQSSPTSLTALHQHNQQQQHQYTSVEQQVYPLYYRSNLTASRAISFSAPSAINLEFSTVKFDEECNEWLGHTDNKDGGRRDSNDSVLGQSVELNCQTDQWRSLSCLTDSTDQSAPVNFDMSNRAKLPRGIEKIRPHLELIDNVPLLVSLFTDCVPTVTREMLHIMQDYGEVVCVMGSSANCDNMVIFMQADASIAVEPLYPQVCQKIPVFAAEVTPTSGPSPVELSRALNSISCPVSMRREDPIPLYHLIMEGRHYTKCMMNSLQYWMCCTCMLSLLQLTVTLLMLPSMFTTGEIIFICCIIVPAVSTSLLSQPVDSLVMQTATGKNMCKINSDIILFVIWCYGSKFLPSLFITVTVYLVTLSCYCHELSSVTNTTCTYVYIHDSNNSEQDYEDSWANYNTTLTPVKQLSIFVFVLLLVVTSASFVDRSNSILKTSPLSNKLWLTCSVCAVLVQMCVSLFKSYTSTSTDVVTPVPWYMITFALFSSVLVLLINEGTKLQEIKVNERYQRRKRLDFGTKLGMNSPF